VTVPYGTLSATQNFPIDDARSDVSTDAVILVGGMGTRLRPLTLSAPKPMLPTAGVPFLLHLVTRIRDAGVTHIVLGTSYQAEVFESYFGDGSSLGVEIEYVVETEPLGTGGGIRNVADRLRGDTVLIFNGDVLSGVDLRALLATHERTGADVTLYLTKVDDPRAFGCVPTDADGWVTAFLEKDPNPVTDQINAGTYVFSRAVVDAIPAGRPVSVERETFPGLLAARARIAAHVDTTYWRDLGRPADFVAGSADLVQGFAPSPALPGPVGPALVLPGAKVDGTAVLTGGATIGTGASVGAEATVDGSVLFDGAVVGTGSVVRRSVVGFGAVIGPGTVIEDAVVGDRARIGGGVELLAGARVWPDVVLPDGSVRFSSDL
jgi:mannose-1-phosphate guanylyltransferase